MKIREDLLIQDWKDGWVLSKGSIGVKICWNVFSGVVKNFRVLGSGVEFYHNPFYTPSSSLATERVRELIAGEGWGEDDTLLGMRFSRYSPHSGVTCYTYLGK